MHPWRRGRATRHRRGRFGEASWIPGAAGDAHTGKGVPGVPDDHIPPSQAALRRAAEHGQVKVFISYRRQDVPGDTHRLAATLKARLRNAAVFIDVDKIEPGAPFDEVIDKWLTDCQVLLAVIGQRWLEAKDEDGNQRISKPEDWVRMEIEAALQHGVTVIPVLIDNTSVPTAADLPEGMAQLPRRQGIRLTYDHWDDDVERLATSIERAAGATRRSRKGGRSTWLVAGLALATGVFGAAIAVLASKGPSQQRPETVVQLQSRGTTSVAQRLASAPRTSTAPATPAKTTGSTATAAGSTATAAGSTATAATNAGGVTSTATKTQGQASGTATTTSSSRTLGPLQVVKHYWNDIRGHHFSAAYAYEETDEPESKFREDEQNEHIKSVTFVGKIVSSGESKAQVNVVSLVTHDAVHGCREWEGSYAMSASSGRWLISKANVEHHPCHA
jgi:hypothetical protein